MGYCIRYNKSKKNQENYPQQKKRIAAMTLIFFLLFLILVKAFWGKGNQLLSAVLWPDDIKIIDRAVKEIYASVNNGQNFYGAVQSFCREILYDSLLAR